MDEAAGHPGMLDFDGVLRYLRSLAGPCEPPIGVGAFLLLYASAVEVVVWYLPAREAHREGEVAIPCSALAAAWAALRSGAALDEAALERMGGNPVYGRWLLGLLAQIPGVKVWGDPVALQWSPAEPESEPEQSETMVATTEPEPTIGVPAVARRRVKRRGRKRAEMADVAATVEAAG